MAENNNLVGVPVTLRHGVGNGKFNTGYSYNYGVVDSLSRDSYSGAVSKDELCVYNYKQGENKPAKIEYKDKQHAVFYYDASRLVSFCREKDLLAGFYKKNSKVSTAASLAESAAEYTDYMNNAVKIKADLKDVTLSNGSSVQYAFFKGRDGSGNEIPYRLSGFRRGNRNGHNKADLILNATFDNIELVYDPDAKLDVINDNTKKLESMSARDMGELIRRQREFNSVDAVFTTMAGKKGTNVPCADVVMCREDGTYGTMRLCYPIDGYKRDDVLYNRASDVSLGQDNKGVLFYEHADDIHIQALDLEFNKVVNMTARDMIVKHNEYKASYESEDSYDGYDEDYDEDYDEAGSSVATLRCEYMSCYDEEHDKYIDGVVFSVMGNDMSPVEYRFKSDDDYNHAVVSYTNDDADATDGVLLSWRDDTLLTVYDMATNRRVQGTAGMFSKMQHDYDDIMKNAVSLTTKSVSDDIGIFCQSCDVSVNGQDSQCFLYGSDRNPIRERKLDDMTSGLWAANTRFYTNASKTKSVFARDLAKMQSDYNKMHEMSVSAGQSVEIDNDYDAD